MHASISNESLDFAIKHSKICLAAGGWNEGLMEFRRRERIRHFVVFTGVNVLNVTLKSTP